MRRLPIFNICYIVRQKCGHTKVVLPSFNEWQTFTFMTRRQTYAWKWPCSLIKVLVKDDGIKPVTLKCKNVITLQLLYYIYSFAWTKNMHFPHLNYMSSFSVTCKIILCTILKFIYSEKATKFCEISTLLLTTVHTVKSKVEISENFVAFSEYMNFNTKKHFILMPETEAMLYSSYTKIATLG